MSAEDGVVLTAAELTPAAWAAAAAAGPVRTFNPGLLADGDGWIFAYRFVAADGLRRIGLCRLDRSLRVVPGSALPLSAGLRFDRAAVLPEMARAWFADPRLYRLHGRVFVYWNSGWHEPRNFQFLHELDPATLAPIGVARELTLAGGGRRPLEKNWTLFPGPPGEARIVYSILPHRVLRLPLGPVGAAGDLVGEELAHTNWTLSDYPSCHGGLRGGTPPVAADDGWISFCHSVHDGPEGYRYRAAAYRFRAAVDFAPTHAPLAPLELFRPPGPARHFPALNPAVDEVIYPCGAARRGDDWFVSFGYNDERCAIARLRDATLRAALRPIQAR